MPMSIKFRDMTKMSLLIITIKHYTKLPGNAIRKERQIVCVCVYVYIWNLKQSLAKYFK